MSEEIRDDGRRKVTSVGNSWIVCKSKSHPGRVFYFNSLTGDAAWNLSDAEIEKAKRRTKQLEHQPGATPTKYSEPKEKPPSAPIITSKHGQPHVNEQVVINRFSEQQSSVLTYSNAGNSNPPFGTSLNQMSGIMQNTQISNPTSIDPACNFNSLNNSISTYHINTAPTLYNPKVWAIPQTQQVFITPAVAPIVPILNHSPESMNVPYNCLSQPTGLDLNSFDHSNAAGSTGGSHAFYTSHLNNSQGVKRPINQRMGFASKNDLRQKLSSKKRFNHNSGIQGGSGIQKKYTRNTDSTACSATNDDEEIHSNNLAMEGRCIETQLHEASSKLDLAPLKCLAAPDSNTDVWFIVVDLEVLLNEFKFLTTLTDSDEKCHLMVPKRVMEELKTYVTCTENIQARRILRFLSQQIDIGYAYMAEDPSKMEGDSMADVILSTCKELLDNNYHLILLTNDNELLTKGTSNINMFGTDEIKKLLMDNSNKPVATPIKSYLTNDLINKIQIIVPNNTSQNTDTTIYVKNEDSDDDILEIQTIKNTQEDKTAKITVFKRTVDAGIQTDIEDIQASTNISNVVETNTSKVVESSVSNVVVSNAASNSSPQKTKEVIIKRSLASLSDISDKRRAIKLKRSVSNQPSVNSAESEKKQFKWRRKRTTTNENLSSKINQNMDTNTESLQKSVLSLDRQPDKTADHIFGRFQENISDERNSPILGHIESKKINESIESRESSINAYPGNSVSKENVTIEETSTSIISNTESNVDDESNYSTSTYAKTHNYIVQSPKKPMYQVDNIGMEQCLKVKCEEWISRFIQIMEEVLTQVLQQEPTFTHDAMPPPWTLHEAAECVALKFSDNQNIKLAANKLSNLLFHVSDEKGKIAMNMSPYEYMQMYSYGVHLLGALMVVTNSCEDIEVAVESLNKLLQDIRNPNVDSSTNDVFNDCIQDNLANNDESDYSDVRGLNAERSLHEQELLPESNNTVEICKPSPEKRKSSDEEIQKPVKFIRNININNSFFRNLSFQKSKIINEVPQIPTRDQQESLTQSVENKPHNERDSQVPSNQPSIIRKFSKCPEIEEKLKLYIDEEELDYEGYDDEYNTDYHSEDEHYIEQSNDTNDNIIDMRPEEKSEPKSAEIVDSHLTNDDNSKKFKYMMCMLLQEIKKALSQVRVLCDQCYKELKNPERSTELKCELRKMAERAHLHIIRLCRSLESMLDHEKNNPSQNISNLLKQADVNISHVDAGLLDEYRMTVAKCKDHANAFLQSIQTIICDFKS